MNTEARTFPRTPDEQAFWDGIFRDQLPVCMKQQKRRGSIYCAHMAREQADNALAERRDSQKVSP
jgi:hypothetical protein